MYENSTDKYYWEKPLLSYTCVPQVGIIVGGFNTKYEYLNTAEIFAPGQPTCHGHNIAPYPHAAIGSMAGRVSGYGVVCGGAIQEYTDCIRDDLGIGLNQWKN